MKNFKIAILLILILTVERIYSQQTYLVKDISPITRSSDPKSPTKSGTLVFFTSDDGKHSRELWRTDGTENGTFMLTDITTITGTGLNDWPYESQLTDVDGNSNSK